MATLRIFSLSWSAWTPVGRAQQVKTALTLLGVGGG
jgi:hypothetical protein